jgi:hypothetical protein
MTEQVSPQINNRRPNCHLFAVPILTKEIINEAHLELLEQLCTFLNDSHLMRRLLRCKDCGQRYFYEFREEMDFLNGEDPQYRTYIAVTADEPLNRLINSDMFFSGALETHPHIKHDWPIDGTQTVSRFPK